MEAKQNLIGWVLAGGKSQRMGQDKAMISYYGKPQALYMWEMLTLEGIETHLSVGINLGMADNLGVSGIMDLIPGQGPLGAIYTAQQRFPHCPILLMACDMPLVGKEDVGLLIENRKPVVDVSVFWNTEKKQVEPMLSIWEISSQPFVKEALGQGRRSIMKLLETMNVHAIPHPVPHHFLNINTREEWIAFQQSRRR
ncbi:MAG: molybdenum cofactor guanylyltransferase [Bacteroidota bacterium]